ncbi:MAG: type I-F CRISPR-associated protein Csy1 [Chlamydiota bacterium]
MEFQKIGLFMEYGGLSAKIADYIADKAREKLDKLDKKADKQCEEAVDETSQAELELVLKEQRYKEEQRFKPSNWLTDASCRAQQIKMVTHALKFANSDAKGSSLYFPEGDAQPEGLLDGVVVSTASLKKTKIDVVGNAAALDVAKLLQLEDSNKTLIEYIAVGDASPLEPFAEDDNQLKEWLEGFNKVLVADKLSSHTFAKQIYFPVAEGQYHLLSPLYSSSLAQALYERVCSTRFSDESKEAREAKHKKKYSDMLVVSYPNIAIQSYGGANKQNISLLNSQRGGKGFLLSCAPPSWQTQTKPPMGTETVFSQKIHFGFKAGKNVWFLQQYLLKHKDKNNETIRDRRAHFVDEIIDLLIQYAAEIQNIPGQGGWSALPECKLSHAEQLWLDPYRSRQDSDFAEERKKNEWQSKIAKKFADWLNKRIENEKLNFGDVEHNEWQSLLEQKLRRLEDTLEDYYHG